MKKLHSGFTIAELLLSMLIVVVLAAALVPVIGPKKMKIPNFNKSHGIYECYWEEQDGEPQLMEFYANNRNKENLSSHHVAGDHCVFNVPDADKYDIFAVGAGSDGYPGSDLSESEYELNSSIDNTKDPITGFIYLDNPAENKDFKSSIAAANEKVRRGDDKDIPGIGKVTINLSSEIADMFDDWAESLRADERLQRSGANDLYIGFTDLKTPVGAGGKGLARRYTVSVDLPDGSNCMSPDVCPASPRCKGPYKNPTDEFPLYSGEILEEMSFATKAAGMCYFYLHQGGGNSAKGRSLKSGYALFFPISGLTKSDEGFSVTVNSEEVSIDSHMHRDGEMKRAYLSLKKRGDGYDAYTENANNIIVLQKGRDFSSNSIDDTLENNYHLAKYKYPGGPLLSLSSLLALFPSDSNLLHYGATHGTESGNGFTAPPDEENHATPGEATYTNKAFKWSYSRFKMNYNYGQAGHPGDIHLMTYNNLHGKLYLFPGKDGVSTVVSKAPSRDNEDTYILEAASYDTPVGPTYVSELLIPGDMPFPAQSVMDLTVPNNDKFDAYIAKIREAGFRGGLYNCNQIERNAEGEITKYPSCPGYAGRGAYPFVYVDKAPITLTLEDLQKETVGYNPGRDSIRKESDSLKPPFNKALAGKRGVKREYEARFMPKQGEEKCKADSRYPDYPLNPIPIGPEKELNIDGEKIPYQPKFCFGSPAKRRDGAVIIVW